MDKISINSNIEYYSILDENGMHRYKKDNISDLNALVEFLMEEVEKADDKQEQWFKMYWEMKQKVNRVKDIVSDDET